MMHNPHRFTPRIIKIASLAATAAALCIILAACSDEIEMKDLAPIDYTYENSDLYNAGATEITGVTDFDIDWSSGDIQIFCNTGTAVSIREESSDSLSEEEQMQWWLDGAILHVRNCSSGQIDPSKKVTKTLYVSLPATFGTKTITANNSGGNINATIISAEGCTFTTSGYDITMETANMPANISMKTGDAGSISLTLPQNDGFTATAISTGGEVSCTFQTTKSGNAYTFGNGASTLELRSAGNVTITQK